MSLAEGTTSTVVNTVLGGYDRGCYIHIVPSSQCMLWFVYITIDAQCSAVVSVGLHSCGLMCPSVCISCVLVRIQDAESPLLIRLNLNVSVCVGVGVLARYCISNNFYQE